VIVCDWQLVELHRWVPIVVYRDDGRPCLCYHPHDDECRCELPT
jgi:hypothetical protein